jgi:hypothetical protein
MNAENADDFCGWCYSENLGTKQPRGANRVGEGGLRTHRKRPVFICVSQRSSAANNLIRVNLWLPFAYLLWCDSSPRPVPWQDMYGATMEITT